MQTNIKEGHLAMYTREVPSENGIRFGYWNSGR